MVCSLDQAFGGIEQIKIKKKSKKNKLKQDIVYPQEITRRSQFLHKLSDDKKNKFLQQNINKMSNILIESYEEGFVSGFSSNYIKVKTKGDSIEVNTIIKPGSLPIPYYVKALLLS